MNQGNRFFTGPLKTDTLDIFFCFGIAENGIHTFNLGPLNGAQPDFRFMVIAGEPGTQISADECCQVRWFPDTTWKILA